MEQTYSGLYSAVFVSHEFIYEYLIALIINGLEKSCVNQCNFHVYADIIPSFTDPI